MFYCDDEGLWRSFTSGRCWNLPRQQAASALLNARKLNRNYHTVGLLITSGIIAHSPRSVKNKGPAKASGECMGRGPRYGDVTGNVRSVCLASRSPVRVPAGLKSSCGRAVGRHSSVTFLSCYSHQAARNKQPLFAGIGIGLRWNAAEPSAPEKVSKHRRSFSKRGEPLYAPMLVIFTCEGSWGKNKRGCLQTWNWYEGFKQIRDVLGSGRKVPCLRSSFKIKEEKRPAPDHIHNLFFH